MTFTSSYPPYDPTDTSGLVEHPFIVGRSHFLTTDSRERCHLRSINTFLQVHPSYETVVKRWPIIITGVVNYLHNKCHTLSLDLTGLDAEEKAVLQKKLTEGTGIIEKVSKLKYEMARDRVLE
jgi:hypothetical protein